MNRREYLLPTIAPELLAKLGAEAFRHTRVIEVTAAEFDQIRGYTIHHQGVTMSTIIHSDESHIITKDGDGYHVSALGPEVATVDQGTGEVCRKRPAISTITVLRLRPGLLGAILLDSLKDQSGSAKAADLAITLLKRSMYHISVLEVRADKLAAKGQVSK